MKLTQRVRRGSVVAAVVASVAMIAGAAGVNAGDALSDEPVATAVPTPTPTAPPETTAAPETTEVPEPTEPTEPTEPPSDTAPTTTVAPPPSSTTPPAAPPAKGGSTPADAIATTTTTPAAVAEPVSLVAKPSAPTSPVATPANGAVKLTWKAPASNGGAAIQKYAVQRYDTVSKTWVSIAYPTALAYTNTGLSNGTSYSFRVLAYNSAGWGAVSTTVAAVPRTVPSAPTSPVATPGNGSVTLSWKVPASNGAAIDMYAVQRYNPATAKWENVAFPKTSPYANAGVKNGTKYSYRIAAHNAAGWGIASTVVAAVPNGPSAPLSPAATPGNSKVTLTWKAPAYTGGMTIDYVVQRSMNGTTGWENIAYPKTPTYNAFGLNGVKYYFRIIAHTAKGYGPASAVVSAVPRSVPGAPYAVQAIPSDSYVSLYWSGTPNGGAPIDKYRVRRATSPNGPWSAPIETTLTYGGWSGLNGTTYYFQVAAHNAAGWGQYSWTVNATSRTVPSAPGLTAEVKSPTQLSLTWTLPASTGGAPIELLRIEQSRAGGPWTLITTTAPGSASMQVTNLVPGSTYQFRAAAQNAAGWGPDTVVSVKTPAKLPDAPTACSAVQSSHNMMDVDWAAPTTDGGSPIVNYHIKIARMEWTWVWSWSGVSLDFGYWTWKQVAIVLDDDTVGPFTDRTMGVPPGDYKINISARNSVGLGPSCEAWVKIT